MNTQMYNLNIRPGYGIPPYVNVSQDDVGRPLGFTMYDGASNLTIASGTTVTAHGTKFNGLGFTVACTWSGSVVYLSTTADMTEMSGNIPAELVFTYGDTVIASANFMLIVEPSPHTQGTTDGSGDVAASLQAQIGTLANLDTANKSNLVAAINELTSSDGLTESIKSALLACFANVAWANSNGDTYYDALHDALYDTTWSITNNLTGCVNSNAATSVTKNASYSATITANAHYALDTVTVTMGGTDVTSTVYSSGTITIPSVTGAVVITATAVTSVSSISAVYTQSGTVYATDTLDSLKSDLVVTATYSDSTTDTVASSDYTLSGTLAEGTSTVTVTYGGQTTTFTVTVSSGSGVPTGYTGVSYIQSSGDAYIDTGIKEVPDGVTKFWGSFAANVASTNTKSLFGYQGIASGQVSTFRLLLLLTTSNELAYYGATSGISSAIGGWNTSGVNDVTVSLTDDTTYPVFIVNNVTTTGNKQKTTTSNSGVGTIYLLAQNYKAGGADATDKAVDGSYIRCYGFKIFGANNALLRDYVPCVRTADSIAGLYDFITETFYPSIGENAFTSGV